MTLSVAATLLLNLASSSDPVSVLLLTAVLVVCAVGPTLAGASAEVERSTPRLGIRERSLHLLLLTGAVAAPLLLVAGTTTAQGLPGIVLRAVPSAVGLLALGAVLFGRASWVLPTLVFIPVVLTGAAHSGWQRLATWPLQDPAWLPASEVAAAAAVVGAAAYAYRGANR